MLGDFHPWLRSVPLAFMLSGVAWVVFGVNGMTWRSLAVVRVTLVLVALPVIALMFLAPPALAATWGLSDAALFCALLAACFCLPCPLSLAGRLAGNPCRVAAERKDVTAATARTMRWSIAAFAAVAQPTLGVAVWIGGYPLVTAVTWSSALTLIAATYCTAVGCWVDRPGSA